MSTDGQGEGDYLRTTFLKRLAHDVRGPAGVVQLAVDELDHLLGDQQGTHRTLLTKARRGITRLLRLASRLDQTADLVGGVAHFSPVACDLCDVVRRAVASTEAIEARRNVSITVETPDAPLPCQLDAQWMNEAFSELASNAIRHAKRRVQVRVGAEDGEARVVFADDNDMSQGFAPSRFQPPHERRGLGLGLALVQDVVLAHRGRLDIRIDTSAELRTCVSVTLPREQGGAMKSIPEERSQS
jgi:signal transduction histidine kinase